VNVLKYLQSKTGSYLLATVAVLVAAAIRFALGPVLGANIPVVIFTVAVVISAFFGGFGPSIYATVLSALISTYFFIFPYNSFEISDLRGVTVLSVFLCIGVTISLLGQRLKVLQTRNEIQAKRLESENQRKDEFLAMLGHELRNPLAGISAASELLKFTGWDERRATQTNELISRQVQHMTKLVDDLLDISRVNRGLISIEKKPVDLNLCVHSAVEQLGNLFEDKRHHLRLDLASNPAWVLGDQTRLVQVISNILNNAAKYTPEGGTIVLSLEAQPEHIDLRVKDNGSGISDVLLPDIFDLFVQANRTPDRSQGGLGVGLALVKSIVDLHGGKVTAESEGRGKGSTFSISLPRLNRTEPEIKVSEHKAPQPARLMPLNILIVDDNRDAANALGYLLDAQGHDIVIEYDTKHALDRAQTERLDVLLLDIGLPHIDGFQLARTLRLMPHLSNAVFIAVTGYGQPKDKEQAKAAGFNYHFTKPVDIAKLNDLLAEIGWALRG
jgi:signal transduction histidine kinase